MKLSLTRKIVVALALAAATTACNNAVTASVQPAPAPAGEMASPPSNVVPSPVAAAPLASKEAPQSGDVALPPGIAPDSQLAQVIKLAQAGVDEGVIRTYVDNLTGAFDLDAEKIIALKDTGVPSDIINSMLERDKAVYAAILNKPSAPPAAVVPPAPAELAASPAALAPAPAPIPAPPVTQVTVNYFNDTLSPYGSWVEVDGYGRCWRPTVAHYDSTWRPYCDRGRWVYTDCGWYWDSDYSWGATFHYGRWFRNARFGWCWYPDTVWGPSWVTFRSSSDYYGWAPLPPLAVFRPGLGFYYRGASVSIGFDFGLDAGCFTFISPSRFCDRRPRDYCAPPQRVTQIIQQTTVVNNYNIRNTTIINNGISVQQVNTHTPRPVEAVTVAALPNATRHGWRGEGSERSGRGDNHANGVANNNNNAAATVSSGGSRTGQPATGQNRPGEQRGLAAGNSAPRPSVAPTTSERNASNDRNRIRERGTSDLNPQLQAKSQPQPKPVVSAPVENRGSTTGRTDQQNNGQNGNRNVSPQQRPQPQAQSQPGPVVGAPVENRGPTSYRVEQRNNGQGGNRPQQPQVVSPPANNVVAERNQRAYNTPPTSPERFQSENNSRITREQPRQFNSPSAPAMSVPAARPAPQIEQRQFTPPVQERVQERAPQPAQRVEQYQRAEQRSRTVESAPRSYSPPPAPAPTPAPAPSQARSSERSSERSSGRNSDRDK